MTIHEIAYGDLRNLVSGRLLAVSAVCSCGEWGLTNLVDGRPHEPGLVAGEEELVYAARLHQELAVVGSGHFGADMLAAVAATGSGASLLRPVT